MRLPAARVLENIEKGMVARGYLLLGREVYWRDRIVRALRQGLGLDPSELGLNEFDLRQEPLDKVLETARTPSLLAPQQLLLVRNAQATPARRRRPTEDSHPQASDALAAYFRDPSPFSILVLEMMDVDLESADWREREKVKERLEAFADICDVVLLAAPDFGKATELVRQEAARRGRKISSEAAERLVAAFERDLGQISMELEKLCLFRPESDRIEVEDLAWITSGSGGDSSLGLTEAIGSGNAAQALESLASGERSGRYPPLVVAEVARYLRQLVLLKENQVRDPRQAGKILWAARLSAPQATVPGLVEQARRFPLGHLLRGLRLASQADLALRSSPPDETIILERLVLELMRPLRAKPRAPSRL